MISNNSIQTRNESIARTFIIVVAIAAHYFLTAEYGILFPLPGFRAPSTVLGMMILLNSFLQVLIVWKVIGMLNGRAKFTSLQKWVGIILFVLIIIVDIASIGLAASMRGLL